jgi:site-specific DNA-methyltransferase (adenine-specific)
MDSRMVTILTGDCREVLKTLPDASAHCCVTSPPYWGLRDYGVDAQIGLERTPEEYVASLVAVFRDVRRVLRDDGTLWLNLGDSYTANAGQRQSDDAKGPKQCTNRGSTDLGSRSLDNLPAKNLVGIPWRVAFALQADGWWLRSDIIWAKPNPMPESVTDRPTKSHEYLFLLAKSERYYYDAAAIKEECSPEMQRRAAAGHTRGANGKVDASRCDAATLRGTDAKTINVTGGRNKRDVWTVPTAPYSGAHFATFPPALILPCILAGCPVGGTVLDPFGGSGTTGAVASGNSRKAVLIELNPAYAHLAQDRCGEMFCHSIHLPSP